MNKLTSYLFETNAFRVCGENKPFWYTSGKIGPYFVNVQFLYGSEKEANELLDFINYELENVPKESLPKDIFSKVLFQYENNEIYAYFINSLNEHIKNNISLDDIDYISGGERRDWFFSNMVAYILKKPHITIFKDLTCIESSYNFSINKLVNKADKINVLHAADLLHQASSYLRAWIPAVNSLGAKIVWSICPVDRVQGGTQKLIEAGIKPMSLININNQLFDEAFSLGIINKNQLTILKKFAENPDVSMRNFLISHPEFINDSMNSSNEKIAKRAKLCIDTDIYNLK